MQNSKLRGINPRFLLAARQRASKTCALLSLRSVGSEFKIFLFPLCSFIFNPASQSFSCFGSA